MKKTLAILLALLMIFSMVACSAKEDPKQDEQNPTDSEQKPAEDKKEDDKQEEESGDAYVNGTLPFVSEPTVITIGLNQNSLTENYDTNKYTLWLEEQTGVDLEFVYFSSDSTEATTQLNLMISGGQKLPDILWGMVGFKEALMYELGQDGYLIDLTDYFEQYGHYFWEEYAVLSELEQKNLFAYGKDPSTGAMYAFPRFSQGVGLDNPVAHMQINKNWLEAVQMDAPTNVDELYEVLKAFAEQDPNGNGIKDEICLTGDVDEWKTDLSQYIINAYVYCNDNYFFNATDGKVWVPYVTDEYREALKYMNKLYAEGLLSATYFSMNGYTEIMSLLTPQEGPSTLGIFCGHPILTWETNSPYAYEYTALAPLDAATELGGYGALDSQTYQYDTFITSDCQDPVLAFRLLDFMSGRESFWRARYGEFGVDWTYATEGQTSVIGEPAFIQILDDSAFGTQNNRCWHDVHATIAHNPGNWSDAFSSEEGTWNHYFQFEIKNKVRNASYDKGLPSEVIYKLVYTMDELEQVSEQQTLITDYVKSQRALFISGELDPNSDEAWNNYLAALENQGLNDWLAAAQAAYTRMNG